MLCKPWTGGNTHISKVIKRRTKEAVFYLLTSARIFFFFKGVGEIRRRAQGGSGKRMEKSGKIKIGNERNGLLCTDTCKNAPN